MNLSLQTALLATLLLAPLQPVSAASKLKSKPSVSVLDVSSLEGSHGADERLLAAALQGLANRSGANVFLFTGDTNWVATFKREGIVHDPAVLTKYRNTDDVWMEYYQRNKGYEFKNLRSLENLVDKFAKRAAGVVIFNSAVPFQWVTAMGLGAPLDLLPVTEAILSKYPALQKLPVRYDLRQRPEESSLELQRWAWTEVKAVCSKEGAYSVGGETDRFAMDIAFCEKMFVYRLGTDKSKTPDEFAMIEEILHSLNPMSPAWGWGIPDESKLRDAASRAGMFVMCSEVPNISFHKQVAPAAHGAFDRVAQAPAPGAVPLEDKFYVAFMVNEGDTMKAAATMEGYGMWLQPERGKVPISWGVCPWIYDHFPGLMEYYQHTMSPKDAIFSAGGGYAYFTPGLTPYLKEYAQKERDFAPKAKLRVGASWAANTLKTDQAIAEWFDRRGLDGFIREDGKYFRLTFTDENRPIISTDWKMFYPMYRFDKPERKEQLRREAEFLTRLSEQYNPPLFIPYYGGTPQAFAEIAALLPADKFSFVTVDTLVKLARKSGELQIAGRNVRGVLPDAVAEVPLTVNVRNMGARPREGTVTVEPPASGWVVEPAALSYAKLAPKVGHAELKFTIRSVGPVGAGGSHEFVVRDSAVKRTARLTLKATNDPKQFEDREPEPTKKPAKPKTVDHEN